MSDLKKPGTIALSADDLAVCTPETFAGLLPTRPFCADDVKEGLQILPRHIAIKKRHIQFNGPQGKRFLLHDVDHAHTYFAHKDALLPLPNIVMINRLTGRGHCAYMLEMPVADHGNARAGPLRFYEAVSRGIARRLEADRAYSGLMAKNPLHDDWLVEWRRSEGHSLEELSDWLFPEDMKLWPREERDVLASRNVAVFDALRNWAMRNVLEFKRQGKTQSEFQETLIDRCFVLAQQCMPALPAREIRSISKSVCQWTWRHFNEEAFSRVQADRGRRGAMKRWGGKPTLAAARPWDDEGISRRTWFRRRKVRLD